MRIPWNTSENSLKPQEQFRSLKAIRNPKQSFESSNNASKNEKKNLSETLCSLKTSDIPLDPMGSHHVAFDHTSRPPTYPSLYMVYLVCTWYIWWEGEPFSTTGSCGRSEVDKVLYHPESVSVYRNTAVLACPVVRGSVCQYVLHF